MSDVSANESGIITGPEVIGFYRQFSGIRPVEFDIGNSVLADRYTLMAGFDKALMEQIMDNVTKPPILDDHHKDSAERFPDHASFVSWWFNHRGVCLYLYLETFRDEKRADQLALYNWVRPPTQQELKRPDYKIDYRSGFTHHASRIRVCAGYEGKISEVEQGVILQATIDDFKKTHGLGGKTLKESTDSQIRQAGQVKFENQ